jgi:hypothetical protein
VVVHLYGRATAETKGGELEPPLPPPRGNVDESEAAWNQHATKGRERLTRLIEMLQHRQTQDEIERAVRDRGQRILDRSHSGPNLGMILEICGELDID